VSADLSSPGPILEVSGLGKRFGGFVALDNINLSIALGESPTSIANPAAVVSREVTNG